MIRPIRRPRFRDLRLAALVVLVVSLFAALSGTARAQDEQRLVIRSVDALRYPETKVVVAPVGPAPSPASYEVEQNDETVSALQVASLDRRRHGCRHRLRGRHEQRHGS